jgi:hypothetical protein
LILALLDAEVRDMVKLVKAGKAAYDGEDGALRQGGDALGSALETAGPFVKQIMNALQGKRGEEEESGVGAEARRIVEALRATGVKGVAVGMDGPCVVAESGERKVITLHVTDAEKAQLAGAGLAGAGAEAVFETVRVEVSLPARAQSIGWDHVARNPDLGRDYAGIVAGFDLVGDRDRCKDQCLARGWVPGELGAYEDQHPDDSQGRHWAWVGVGLSEYLAAKAPPLPLPELSLRGDGERVEVTFDEVAIGAVVAAELEAAVPMFAGARVARETIWKVTLMDGANREEAEEIQAQVDANQPDEDPYVTPMLDEVFGR